MRTVSAYKCRTSRRSMCVCVLGERCKAAELIVSSFRGQSCSVKNLVAGKLLRTCILGHANGPFTHTLRVTVLSVAMRIAARCCHRRQLDALCAAAWEIVTECISMAAFTHTLRCALLRCARKTRVCTGAAYVWTAHNVQMTGLRLVCQRIFARCCRQVHSLYCESARDDKLTRLLV